jgi:alkylated DNA repair dioxygenase AlkB
MIRVTKNYITQEQIDAILEKMPKTKLREKKSDLPNELADHGAHSMPEYFEVILDKLHKDGTFAEKPNAVTVLEYLPSQSIHEHIDDIVYGERVAVISLKGSATMRFQNNGQIKDHLVSESDLITFDEEHRWEWTHTILPVTERRISLVIRKEI